jgi:hypothetical protein
MNEQYVYPSVRDVISTPDLFNLLLKFDMRLFS